MYKVTSEIYKETNFRPVKGEDGKVLSAFTFTYPQESPTTDKDGDLLLSRRRTTGAIEIEHSEATELRLVGLQVWRGALLLADFIFHRREELRDQKLLELGAGVGLTSIAAAIYVKHVTVSDVNIGGILELIRANVKRNSNLFGGQQVQVREYDFMLPLEDYPPELLKAIDEADVVLAADVIYDDTLTDAFIRVLDIIFEREAATRKRKTIYVALEKRFVFALSELDAVAPMYEYFLKQTIKKPWHIEYIPLDFQQYFDYERCKQLILFKITAHR